MPFGADDMKATCLGNARTELNIGAAACHVSSDGNPASLAGAAYDFRFLLMVFGVQDSVNDALFFEHA